METFALGNGDLVGTFGCPLEGGPFPGVLALGGSNGGIPEVYLRALVPQGFACLAQEFFGTSRTQRALIEVPLERIERGLRWLARHPKVAAPDGRVGVMGGSKGGELALLVAATFPDLVGPVVAYTPSSVVWAGIDFNDRERMKRSSWMKDGEPLPFVPYPAGVIPTRSERGLSVLPIYEGGLDNAEAVRDALIPVERARGPLLLISGGDDRMWPAERMCRMAMERMHAHARTDAARHLNYPDAGHVLMPYPPARGGAPMPMPFDLGGTPAASLAAHTDAWPQALAILHHERLE